MTGPELVYAAHRDVWSGLLSQDPLSEVGVPAVYFTLITSLATLKVIYEAWGVIQA